MTNTELLALLLSITGLACAALAFGLPAWK